ncbi:hypothetical protein MKZ38_002107 [Zalerion maritima]|uniref:Developmental regulatory protein wetA n=1 Tax=Zalerion maritima TaxID=339359 RepID=A0AAD5WRI1_9PEZI|nr:hypothetical protein MKZ38_002107 [Zalerion maritima]
MDISTQNSDYQYTSFEFDLEKAPGDLWQQSLENEIPSEFLDQFLFGSDPPLAPTTSAYDLPPLPSPAILPETVLPSVAECNSSSTQPAPHSTHRGENNGSELLSLTEADFLDLENDLLFSDAIDACNGASQESISDSELLKLEGITLFSPQKSQPPPSSVPSSPTKSIRKAQWWESKEDTARRIPRGQSPAKNHDDWERKTAFKADKSSNKHANQGLPRSPPLSVLLENSKPPVEHVSFVNGQLEDPFIDSALAPTPLRAASSKKNHDDTSISDGSPSLFYAPGFKPFSRQHIPANPVLQPLDIQEGHHSEQQQQKQHTRPTHQQQRRPPHLQLHGQNSTGVMAVEHSDSSMAPDSAVWPLSSPLGHHNNNNHGYQQGSQGMINSPGNWWDQSTVANTHANARSATMDLNMQMMNTPELNGFNSPTRAHNQNVSPQSAPPIPRHHHIRNQDMASADPMIQMPQQQRRPGQPQPQVMVNHLAVQGHAYFPPPTPSSQHRMRPHHQISPQHHRSLQISPSRSDRRRRCPSTRDRYPVISSSATTLGTPSNSISMRRVSSLRRSDSTSPTPRLQRSTSMCMLDHHNNPHRLPPPRQPGRAIRKRRSWTRSNSSNSNTRSSGRSRSRSNGGAPDPFVNYTPFDHETLMAGVAPSGSSKTKARREREAMEGRRRIGEMAMKAVQAAGGDFKALVGAVELEAEGGCTTTTSTRFGFDKDLEIEMEMAMEAGTGMGEVGC